MSIAKKTQPKTKEKVCLCVTIRLFPDKDSVFLLTKVMETSKSALDWLINKSVEIGTPNKILLNAYYEDVRSLFGFSSSQVNVYTSLAVMMRREKNTEALEWLKDKSMLVLDRKGFSMKRFPLIEITTLSGMKRISVPFQIVGYREVKPLSRSAFWFVIFMEEGRWMANYYLPLPSSEEFHRHLPLSLSKDSS